MIRWYVESENRAFETGASGLFYFPVRRRTAIDRFAAECTAIFPPYFDPPLFGTTFPHNALVENEDAPRLRKRRRRKRVSLLSILAGEPNSLTILPVDDTILFFSHIDDDGDLRRLRAEKRWAKRRVGALQEQASFQLDVAWTVWAFTPAQILDEIQYHLLEPVIDSGQTWQYYTAEEVQGYVQERCARWLMETCLVRKRATLNLTSGVSQYALDPEIAALQRVYLGGQLNRWDRYQLDRAKPAWESLPAGTPSKFFEDPDKTITLVPPPSGGGLSYVYISTAASEGSGSFAFVPMTVPSTFSWGIKYGVMADMLGREGEGYDPNRAEYCETRFKDSISLAQLLMGEQVQSGK